MVDSPIKLSLYISLYYSCPSSIRELDGCHFCWCVSSQCLVRSEEIVMCEIVTQNYLSCISILHPSHNLSRIFQGSMKLPIRFVFIRPLNPCNCICHMSAPDTCSIPSKYAANLSETRTQVIWSCTVSTDCVTTFCWNHAALQHEKSILRKLQIQYIGQLQDKTYVKLDKMMS